LRHLTRLAVAIAVVAAPGAAIAAQPVTGRWVTEDGKAIVTIGTCGTTICGQVTRILVNPPGGPPVDANNPDPKLRKRPVQGLQILSGFTPDGDTWKGRIYSPEEGKTYKSVLQREGADTLKVKGCVLFFCKTQTWKKAG
jgi:uncharacterized protein (DUF2147 family)